MSKTLQERLASHADSFSGLLSLIPAKHYYNDESSNQWKGGKKKNKNKAKQHSKKQKFESESSGSALEELNRRQAASDDDDNKESESEGTNSDDDDIIMGFDDAGNALGDEGEDGEANASIAVSDDKKVVKEKPEEKKPVNKKPQIKHHNGSVESQPASTSDSTTEAKPKSEGIQELRARLSSKIQELREKRKAPGSGAPGAPVNREAILEARKKRQAAVKEKKAEKRKREETEAEVDDIEDDDNEESRQGSTNDTINKNTLVFNQIEFANGQRTAADSTSIKERRAMKQRDLVGQLKHLKAKKAKIASLDEQKRKAVEENAQWSRAILSAEGQKVRDDEARLRKAVKSQQKRKDKSEKEWKERKERQEKDLQRRLAKREENIQLHKDLKGVKGKKRKQELKKRAGFEGKRAKGKSGKSGKPRK